ncbi:hypothetical protein AU468_07365 [Alkalispirochaeta sphaeroplastigenens]|uniref:HTH araC/xylS-type domain-containing protein n=1 Tax=Alkalispirochaeta sphaeroplastigenens TaxID=1187066 RepID=A0A2S4JRF7_9SPIO|nr:helix-turn-helix domain-containing protein [Alkalispirochaeta sphaeroplastigenens]POR02063.1 hypothetical protein AU468_07365 [Alkalispirochaeta sphaeroplastigenens]
MKLLFFIRSMEITSRNLGSGTEDDPDTHELIFCRRGKGTLVRREASVEIQEGSLLFNPRGRLVSSRGRMTVVQILFAEELFSPQVNMDREALYVLGIVKIHARRQNHIALSRIGTERMNSLMEGMLWEYQNRYRGYSWAIRLKLVGLLITLMRDARFNISIKGLKPWSSTRIQDAVLYLNTDYMNPISVEDVLESCGLSRSHFHALFKRETGQTFVEYLSALRCTRAAELLVTTEKTVLQIATESGFNNLSHFHHVFRRRYGMSPGQYRQRQHLVRELPEGSP